MVTPPNNNGQFVGLQSPQSLYGQQFIMAGHYPHLMPHPQQMNAQQLPPMVHQPFVSRAKKILNIVDPDTQCDVDLPSKSHECLLLFNI